MADRRQTPRIVDEPRECFVRIKTDRHGPWYAGRIYSVLGMLRAEINGEPIEPLTVWHWGSFISAHEYEMLMAVTNEPKPF